MDGFVDPQATRRDSRIMPRIYQQVDWSNGGDGIVVRENIKTVADLRGKKLVLAQNSPSQYFALNMLDLRRRAAIGSEHGFSPAMLSKPPRRSTPIKASPAAFRRRRTCTIWPMPKAIACWSPPRSQPPDRRRRFARADFARQHADHRSRQPGYLRRHGAAQGRARAAEGLRAHGLRLQYPRLRRAGDAGRRGTAPTGPRISSSSSTRTTRPSSSASGSGRICSTAASARSATGRCPSIRSWTSRSSRSWARTRSTPRRRSLAGTAATPGAAGRCGPRAKRS